VKIQSVGDQHRRDFSFFADGQILSAAAPQLIFPEHSSRSAFWIQNTSSATMWFGMGSARATCTISGGAVNAVTVTNQGFGFTVPPIVTFLGGGIQPQNGVYPPNSSYVGGAGPGFPAPSPQAQGHAVLTGGKVTSIVIDNPGGNYVKAPMVFMTNSELDPYGCFDPSALQNGVAGSGFQLYPGNSWTYDCNVVPTDPIAVFCATLNATFAAWWTT
jgi:hypothetical protein